MPIRSVITVASPTALDTVVASLTERGGQPRIALGQFFILLHLDDIPSLVPWAGQLISFLETTYYQTLANDPATTVERAVSITRQRTRLKLQQLAREYPAASTASYCLGAIKGNEVVLTHQGATRALLLHKLRTSNGHNVHYRWVDVTATATPTASILQAESATATIISGAVGANDILIVCTESILEALGLDSLQRTLTSGQHSHAITVLERQFKTVGGRRTFAAIVIQSASTNAAPEEDAVTPSMATLTSREQGTSTLLSPRPHGLTGWLRPKRSSNRTASSSPPAVVAPSPAPTRPTATMAWRIGHYLRRLGLGLVAGCLRLITGSFTATQALGSSTGRTTIIERTRAVSDGITDYIASRLKVLPRSAQRLLIIALFFGYLFTQSLVFLASRQGEDVAAEMITTTVMSIQNDLDRAESHLIIGNDDAAVALLNDINTRINDLPQRSRVERQRRQALVDTISTLRARLDRLTTIEQPNRLVAVPSELLPEISGIILVPNGSLLAYEGSSKKFVAVNIKNAEVKAAIISTEGAEALEMHGTDEQGQAIFLNSSGLVTLRRDTNSLITTKFITPPKEQIDFSLYNSRLYILDVSDRQIWRYRRTGDSFGSRTPWLTGDATTLTDATALAVDGAVYILRRDGSIRKFVGGEEQTWQAMMGSIPATQATKLWGPSGSNFLYALDSSSRRLVRWEKETGRLLNQYLLPASIVPIDFAVDERAKIIYVLSNRDIYTIPLTDS